MIDTVQVTGGRRVASSAVLNIFTGLFIVSLNLAFLPMILRAFGNELFGVLSVTWMVLANFTWLDLGFSRASARYVAQALTTAREEEAACWTWSAILSQTVLGIVGAAVLSAFAPFIADRIRVQQEHRQLVVLTLRVFAFSIPVDFANRSASGVLQAAQRFDWLNTLSLLNTVSTFAIYALGILHHRDFRLVVFGLFLVRLLNLAVVHVLAVRIIPPLGFSPPVIALRGKYWKCTVAMARYGFWVAISAMMGPLLLYFDQSVVSVTLGIAVLPFYTVPFNLLLKLSLFPSALSSVLFPAFSALEANRQWRQMERYFVYAHKYLLVILSATLFVIYVWGPQLLRLWIGADFSDSASRPLRILACGFVVALLAPLSSVLLEAVGRPDILVKLYAVELPFNVATVWLLTKHYGIDGAAISFSVRAFAETIVVWVIVHHVVPFSWKRFIRDALLPLFLLLVLLGLTAHFIDAVHLDTAIAMLVTAVALIVYTFGAQALIFGSDERDMFLSACKHLCLRLGALWQA